MHFVRDIELLGILVSKELKIRYKSSMLGYIWAIANPLAFAFVYYVAFKIIMRIEMENYAIFLLTGMFPWMWLSNALQTAIGSFRNNIPLIKYVALPRYIMPLSNVVHEAVHFFFALPVLIFFVLFTGGDFYPNWLWQVPVLIFLQFIFIYPFALLFALFNVFVHDVEYLVGISLSLLFFLTPIVYPPGMVPDAYAVYFDLSPLAGLVNLWRGILLQGQFSLPDFLLVLAVSSIMAVFAFVLYRKVGKKVGELL